ncbi:flavin reductase family protein [Enterovirga aerilata]|uniref:Flavin reductase family protein n=1 Tax=Enterovirga aerilata TaxID=2730920 RepID=A0A849IH77_9HYPH|nr:flavin reductase family protein [Enterovirga sp. DB1703]NNM73273.1 flavin reductase family protein [Enterovirga sp. DB1703]
MFYDATKNDHGLRHNPMKALIGPRPIGWISALNARGEVNLSPYSFFNAVAENPFIVAFSSNGYKDAVAFVDETKEFVCSLATWDTREAMNLTSAPLARGESEFAFAGLTQAPSRLVKPPRVAEAPAALECQWLRTIQLEDRDGRRMEQYLVLGQVIGVHIDDRFVKDGLVDTAAMRPIMRGGYMDYFVATPETKFSIQRPKGA